ncbi:kinase-like domain-containing protein [Dissophora ornata]|nr:kinase-like domain-containing protein [Dissophora ornata]
MSEVPMNHFPDSWGKLGEIPLPSLETRIGRGAFGEVYLWNKKRTQMAVKRIRVTNGCATDIEREMNIVSRLAHKHIIQCYGVDRDANYVYIITDYAEGGNLSDAVPRLDWENRKRIVAEVALGLAYLHRQGVVHRDIKGANILLTKHDEAKLCDFGLAKVIASATCASTYTSKGTLRWMAPELRKARPKYSVKSDIFALGVVMQELVDGDTPLDYAEIMERCLDKDPEKRPTLEAIVHTFQVAPQIHDMSVLAVRNGAVEGSQTEEEQYLWPIMENLLAEVYFHGIGVDVNRAEAAERFRRAASMGHREAQFALGEMYHDGDSVLRDYAKAVEWLQKAADQGHDIAQNNLGLSYLDGGMGVTQDYRQALDLFQAAAYQGNPSACCNLGWMYLHGHGVAKNKEESLRWFREGAERGCSAAQFNMGVCYIHGIGVKEDYAEAAKFMSMAATQGHAEAQCKLALMYANGVGVSRDRLESLNWWRKAAEEGHMEAQCHIGRLYIEGNSDFGIRKNQSKGLMWLKKAAEQGHEEAQYFYGMIRINLN